MSKSRRVQEEVPFHEIENFNIEYLIKALIEAFAENLSAVFKVLIHEVEARVVKVEKKISYLSSKM